MENKKLKSYQVVEFPALRKNQLSSVAVVPRNWIHLEEAQYFCLWPTGYSKKKVEGFVKTKSFLNKKICKEYIINILGQSKSYETACRLAQTLEEESEVALTDGTSSEYPEEGAANNANEIIQNKKCKQKHSVCGISLSVKSNPVPPPFPDESDVALFSGNKSGSGRSIKSNPVWSVKSNTAPLPFPDEADDEKVLFSVNKSGSEGTSTSKHYEKTFQNFGDQEKKLAALESRITELEQKNKFLEVQSFLENEDIVVPPGLPMESKEDLERLNLILQMKSEMALYVEYLRSIGGKVERPKYIRRVLGAMFSKNFSVLCNLNGSSSKMIATGMGKIKLRCYHFVLKCLLSTVRIQYLNSKDKDIYPIVSRWFQGAIDQGDGRINRQTKSKIIKDQLQLINEKNI